MNLTKGLGLLLVVGFLAVGGFYMYKAGGDFTLAKAMMNYDLNNFMGKHTEQESTMFVDTRPNEPAHTKDSIYQGNGSSFTDYKHEATDQQIEVRPSSVVETD